MIIYERVYPVNVFETDTEEKLNLVSLFNIFQDIAGRNASQLGFGRENLMTNRNIWVLSRMSVRIDKMPEQWTDIKVRTWPRGTDKIFAIRDFEVLSQDDEVLVKATSSWVVVDFDTRRLQRPEKALSELNLDFPDKKAMEENAIKITNIPANGCRVKEITASISDIDANQHVNNAMYISWVYNSYEKSYIESHIPVTVDVNYINESHFGDEVCIETSEDNSGTDTFIHNIIRKGANVELCKIRLKWRDRNL